MPSPDYYEIFLAYCAHANRVNATVTFTHDVLPGLENERVQTFTIDQTQVRPDDKVSACRWHEVMARGHDTAWARCKGEMSERDREKEVVAEKGIWVERARRVKKKDGRRRRG